MHIGVPKETKVYEYRVGMSPASVREAVLAGHEVSVERSAGKAIGFLDEDYLAAGARLAETAEELFATAELIVKVKEPLATERAMLREGQILFTYLHLAADETLTRELMGSGSICIAYETVTDRRGRLPLLAPMSEVAGRMSIQAGAHCLEMRSGGRGVLLGGVPGVPRAKVLIIGGGVVGVNAARMAVGANARVTIVDKSTERLAELDAQFGALIETVFSDRSAIEELVSDADLVIGAVLVPGASAPKIVKREMVKTMKPGSVIVDVAIDQGGICETSRPTTHAEPTYAVDGVIHYCVTNMPGAVARTSTLALNNVTLPAVLAIANKGYRDALAEDPCLMNGLSIAEGQLTCAPVANELGLEYVPAAKVLSGELHGIK
jgi:alanine dehydrogenase